MTPVQYLIGALIVLAVATAIFAAWAVNQISALRERQVRSDDIFQVTYGQLRDAHYRLRRDVDDMQMTAEEEQEEDDMAYIYKSLGMAGPERDAETLLRDLLAEIEAKS